MEELDDEIEDVEEVEEEKVRRSRILGLFRIIKVYV